MTVRDLLVVELLGGFGDLLLALPAIHALADAHPGAKVRVLTFAPGADLLTADPRVTAVRSAGPPGPGVARAAVAAELARGRPDLAVTTTRYDGIPDLLDAGADRAVTNLWRDPPADELVDRRFLRLLAADGLIPVTAAGQPLAVALTAADRADGHRLLGPTGPAPVVAIPAAGMVVKQWPAAHWADLAGRVVAAGRPLLVAGPPTGPVGAVLLGAGATQLPAVGLRAFAGVLAAVGDRGGAVVGGDTGPVRLATAVGTPAVGLYGPTLAARYGLSEPGSTSLQGLPGCPVRRPASITDQECWWTARCPLPGTGGHPACMTNITSGAVAAAVLGRAQQ